MRFANQAGRAVVVDGDGVVDIASASGGAFGPASAAVPDDRSIDYLSGLVTPLPRDLIYAGTLSGMAVSNPPRFLRDRDVLLSDAPEIGILQHRFVAAA